MRSFLEYLNENDIVLNEDYYGKTKGITIKDISELIDLPNGTTINGDVSIYEDSSNLTKLPDNLTINGNLVLSNCINLKSLPKGLTVSGYIEIVGNKGPRILSPVKIGNYFLYSKIEYPEDIANFPKNSITNATVNAENCSFKTLPDNFTVGNGDFIIKDCSNLKSLPKNLKVNGILKIINCPNLTSIPNGLKTSELYIENCSKLKKLPLKMIVNDNVTLDNKDIIIPENATWKKVVKYL